MPSQHWVKTARRKVKIQGSKLTAHFLPFTEGEIITNWALQTTWILLQSFQGWLLACLTRSLRLTPESQQVLYPSGGLAWGKNYCQMTSSFDRSALCMVIELKASLSCWFRPVFTPSSLPRGSSLGNDNGIGNWLFQWSAGTFLLYFEVFPSGRKTYLVCLKRLP